MGLALFLIWKCPRCGHYRPASIENLYVVCPECGYWIYDHNRKRNPEPVMGPVLETDAKIIAEHLNNGGQGPLRLPRQASLTEYC